MRFVAYELFFQNLFIHFISEYYVLFHVTIINIGQIVFICFINSVFFFNIIKIHAIDK